MVISLHKWLERTKFLILFVVITYFIYHFMNVLTGWIEPHHRYQEPSGRAVKAFVMQESDNGSSTVKDRLRLFYWYGE